MNERLDRFEMGGRWVEIAVAGVWEVAGGRITLWRDYFDLAMFTRQMQAGRNAG
jgi:limonene-1,2-epoxide hydrolase